MKKLINYTILLSLSFVMFGCGEQLTIDSKSDDYQYIEVSEKGITNYKGNPFNGTIVEYYKNGQLKEEVNYKDGKVEEGLYERYHTNGQLQTEGNYKDGSEVSD